MGIFDIFKKKEEPKETKGGVLLAMPMYNNNESFDSERLITHLREYWHADVTYIENGNENISFRYDGETIVISIMGMSIPWSDLDSVIPYAYNWPKASEDLKKHNNHLIVTNIGSNTDIVTRFTIITKVLASIAATSNVVGIYNGLQSLVIPQKQYIESAEGLKNGQIPVDLWVYIGLRNTPTGRSAYTYGLKEFGKLEMEVINSQMGLEELYEFLLNICSYVIKSNVTFQAGQTLGYTAEQKIKISKSKGIFIEEETFKLDM